MSESTVPSVARSSSARSRNASRWTSAIRTPGSIGSVYDTRSSAVGADNAPVTRASTAIVPPTSRTPNARSVSSRASTRTRATKSASSAFSSAPVISATTPMTSARTSTSAPRVCAAIVASPYDTSATTRSRAVTVRSTDSIGTIPSLGRLNAPLVLAVSEIVPLGSIGAKLSTRPGTRAIAPMSMSSISSVAVYV